MPKLTMRRTTYPLSHTAPWQGAKNNFKKALPYIFIPTSSKKCVPRKADILPAASTLLISNFLYLSDA
jgi:hypothetical protein